MRINNNLMAMNTHRQLGIAASQGSRSMEKLSSGLRINKAGDDAAGLAISEKMRGQIRGLEQASRNAQDGISLIQTAEGALSETQAILQRMRELAVQSSNDTNQSTDRSAIQDEVNQLSAELDRIGDTTQFNGKTLLNGDFASGTADINLQIGANGSQDIQLNIADMRASSATGLNIASAATGAAAVAEVAQVAGTGDEFVSGGVDVSGYTQSDDLDIKIKFLTAGDGAGTNATAEITINGVTKTVTGDDSIATPEFTLDGTNFDIFETGQSVVITGAATPVANDEANIEITGQTSTVTGPDVSTFANAETAIGTIDSAINTVSSERASLGSKQNRLEHTIKNLDNGSENLQAAESRIRDVDMAKEMMNFTKNNILQQAAQAMLAQANQAPQGVLQLLR